MDNTTLFFAIIGLVVAIFFGYTGPFRRQEKKELSFGVLHRGLLIAAMPSVALKAKLQYENEPIERLSAVKFSIMNSGTIDVQKQDFETPITITFADIDKIFSVEVIRNFPVDLPVAHSIVEKAKLVIEPLLLNRGDFMTLRLIVSHSGPIKASISSRVLGITRFHPLNAGVHPGYELFSIIFWGILSSGCATLLYFSATNKSGFWIMALVLVQAAFSSWALFSAIRAAINVKKSRWMGVDTEDLRKGESL